MADGTLYLGTRRYSSWSLRGWLLVQLAELEVEEVVIPITGGSTEAVRQVSPSGLVPYLEHRGACIWESLAIAEYCAEFAPALWPQDRVTRAHARSIAAEMHAGFRALRISMPMNLGADFDGLGQNPESLADVARIERLWGETRARYGAGGDFLFGKGFAAADAMFAPVVTRFLTYGVVLSAEAQAYCEAVRAHPLIARWYTEAELEPLAWRVEKYENPAL